MLNGLLSILEWKRSKLEPKTTNIDMFFPGSLLSSPGKSRASHTVQGEHHVAVTVVHTAHVNLAMFKSMKCLCFSLACRSNRFSAASTALLTVFQVFPYRLSKHLPRPNCLRTLLERPPKVRKPTTWLTSLQLSKYSQDLHWASEDSNLANFKKNKKMPRTI